jgi:hypothetical protein
VLLTQSSSLNPKPNGNGLGWAGLPNTLIWQSYNMYITHVEENTHLKWTVNTLCGSETGQSCDGDPTSCSREHFKRDTSCCNALWALGIAETCTMGKDRGGPCQTCLCQTRPTDRPRQQVQLLSWAKGVNPEL